MERRQLTRILKATGCLHKIRKIKVVVKFITIPITIILLFIVINVFLPSFFHASSSSSSSSSSSLFSSYAKRSYWPSYHSSPGEISPRDIRSLSEISNSELLRFVLTNGTGDVTKRGLVPLEVLEPFVERLEIAEDAEKRNQQKLNMMVSSIGDDDDNNNNNNNNNKNNNVNRLQNVGLTTVQGCVDGAALEINPRGKEASDSKLLSLLVKKMLDNAIVKPPPTLSPLLPSSESAPSHYGSILIQKSESVEPVSMKSTDEYYDGSKIMRADVKSIEEANEKSITEINTNNKMLYQNHTVNGAKINKISKDESKTKTYKDEDHKINVVVPTSNKKANAIGFRHAVNTKLDLKPKTKDIKMNDYKILKDDNTIKISKNNQASKITMTITKPLKKDDENNSVKTKMTITKVNVHKNVKGKGTETHNTHDVRTIKDELFKKHEKGKSASVMVNHSKGKVQGQGELKQGKGFQTLTVEKTKRPLVYCDKTRRPLLVGRMAVQNGVYNLTQLDINNLIPDVEEGGHFRPNYCIPRERTAIIIPFRDRESHLSALLLNLYPVLKRQGIDVTIFVIDEILPTPFNRAMLFNIGFLEASKISSFDCFIFHDVDLIPLDDRNIYQCDPLGPTHYLSGVNKFDYKLPYKTLFGGVVAFTKKQYHVINGASNLYFGWGGEDDDLRKRSENKGYSILRKNRTIGLYDMINHHADVTNKRNPVRKLLLDKATERQDIEGLNTTSYHVISINRLPLFTKIEVDIDFERVLKTAPKYLSNEIKMLRESFTPKAKVP